MLSMIFSSLQLFRILSVFRGIVKEDPGPGSRPMDGKSICNLRMHWLIDGPARLNSGKILTFTKVRSIKRAFCVIMAWTRGFGFKNRNLWGFSPGSEVRKTNFWTETSNFYAVAKMA